MSLMPTTGPTVVRLVVSPEPSWPSAFVPTVRTWVSTAAAAGCNSEDEGPTRAKTSPPTTADIAASVVLARERTVLHPTADPHPLRGQANQPAGALGGPSGRFLLLRLGRARDQGRVDVVADHLGGHHDLGDVLAGRHVVHDVEQDLFDDRPQAAGAGAAHHGQVGERVDRVLAELQL